MDRRTTAACSARRTICGSHVSSGIFLQPAVVTSPFPAVKYKTCEMETEIVKSSKTTFLWLEHKDLLAGVPCSIFSGTHTSERRPEAPTALWWETRRGGKAALRSYDRGEALFLTFFPSPWGGSQNAECGFILTSVTSVIHPSNNTRRGARKIFCALLSNIYWNKNE